MTKTGIPKNSIIHNETQAIAVPFLDEPSNHGSNVQAVPVQNGVYKTNSCDNSSYASAAPGAVRIEGRKPLQLTMCPKCDRNQVRTTTKTYPSVVTWVLVGATATVFWPICWLPLVSDGCKQTDHYCQQCGEKIGQIKALRNVYVKESA
jgi:hypothetical protein